MLKQVGGRGRDTDTMRTCKVTVRLLCRLVQSTSHCSHRTTHCYVLRVILRLLTPAAPTQRRAKAVTLRT